MAAWAKSYGPRTTCLGCGEALTTLDAGHDHCLLCRQAKAQGAIAWGRRMWMVREKRRAAGLGPKLPQDPFKGFREEDEP
jgi:hypothetical protein